jgi:hypothetical protein
MVIRSSLHATQNFYTDVYVRVLVVAELNSFIQLGDERTCAEHQRGVRGGLGGAGAAPIALRSFSKTYLT